MSNMHNPPHPGEFISEVYLGEGNMTGRALAAALDVSPSTLNRILNGNSRVTAEMAVRLSKALGPSPESWLTMQMNYDLWQAKKLPMPRVTALKSLTAYKQKQKIAA